MRPRIGITTTPATFRDRHIDRVNHWYVEAVAGAGGLPLLVPTMAPSDAQEMLAGLDGVVLTGGGDVAPWLYGEEPVPEVYEVDETRDTWESALIRAVDGSRPILGICRGAQLLNVVAGGSLIQHLPRVTGESHWQRERDREAAHDVDVDPDSQLARILGRLRLGVNSIHHQAIARVGDGFRAVAWAPDGIIEAIERTDGAPVVAVQWHPESLVDLQPQHQLFLWLTRCATATRPATAAVVAG